MEHQEELPFGCSICGSKFKSASTLSRHRETHAQVKKPIKKLKIKIIDGSCVISKVDSPAGVQREKESCDNLPAMAQVTAENGGDTRQTRSTLPTVSSSVGLSDLSMIDCGSQSEGKRQPSATYMVEVSTGDGNVLVPHPSDVIEETVIHTASTFMDSSGGEVATQSDNTSNEQTSQFTGGYLTPSCGAQTWPVVESLANHEVIPTTCTCIDSIQYSTQVKEKSLIETSEDIEHHREVLMVRTAADTKTVTEASLTETAQGIKQFSEIPKMESVRRTQTTREMSVIEITPNAGPVVVDTSVKEIAPSGVNSSEAQRWAEVVPARGLDHDPGAEWTVVIIGDIYRTRWSWSNARDWKHCKHGQVRFGMWNKASRILIRLDWVVNIYYLFSSVWVRGRQVSSTLFWSTFVK